MGTTITFKRPDGTGRQLANLANAARCNAHGVVGDSRSGGLVGTIKGCATASAWPAFDSLAPDLYNARWCRITTWNAARQRDELAGFHRTPPRQTCVAHPNNPWQKNSPMSASPACLPRRRRDHPRLREISDCTPRAWCFYWHSRRSRRPAEPHPKFHSAIANRATGGNAGHWSLGFQDNVASNETAASR